VKSILCYGDSNTWGYIPGSGRRYPYHIRWPGQIQSLLGSNFRVIEEGLSGRYTVWDEPFRPGRNGAALLQPLLESHNPLNLLILMLGTNDILHFKDNTPYDAARGIAVLIDIARRTQTGSHGKPPPVLLVAPPVIEKLSETLKLKCHGDFNKSSDFAGHYQETAKEKNCYFFNAAEVCKPSLVDGVHLDADGHGRMARAVADFVRSLDI